MNAGVFKRSFSAVADFVIVFFAVLVLFHLIASPIYQRVAFDDFDALMDRWEALDADRQDEYEALLDRFEQGELDADEFAEANSALRDRYYDMDPEAYDALTAFNMFFAGFHIIGFLFSFGLYMALMKGQSLGRRFTGIYFGGSTHPLNIVVREVFLKYVYWIFTLGIGLMIDIYMVVLTRNNKTLRDMLTKTYITSDPDIVDPHRHNI